MLTLDCGFMFFPVPWNHYAIHRDLLEAPESVRNITNVVDKILKTNMLPKIKELNPRMGLSKQAPGILQLFSKIYSPDHRRLFNVSLRNLNFLQGNQNFSLIQNFNIWRREL